MSTEEKLVTLRKIGDVAEINARQCLAFISYNKKMESEECCPKCKRPMNQGNSPNAEECNETDDDEGVCEAYARIASLIGFALSAAQSTAAAVDLIKETFDRLAVPSQSMFDALDKIVDSWPEEQL
jgi:hypothetical protein